MFRFIDVIGTSQENYEEATKSAIKELLDNHFDVHFFNIIEQRGAVRDKQIEFQTVLKVAVKQDLQKNTYKNDNVKTNGHDPVCEWCGTVIFKQNSKQNTVVCNSCGRISNIEVNSNKIMLK